MNILHVAPARCELQYVSVVWNSITPAEAKKLWGILGSVQQLYPFFPHDHYSDAYAYEHLKLHTISRGYVIMMHSFLFKVIVALTSVPPFWTLLCIYDIILRSSKNCLCGGCPSAANVVLVDADIFVIKIISLNHIL
jgi:hypothetical protein